MQKHNAKAKAVLQARDFKTAEFQIAQREILKGKLKFDLLIEFLKQNNYSLAQAF